MLWGGKEDGVAIWLSKKKKSVNLITNIHIQE
jgi:hypothetical protein